MSINQTINQYLRGRRVPKHEFDDLKTILRECRELTEHKKRQVWDWFRFLRRIEILGWRPKPMTRNLVKILTRNTPSTPIQFYALFCPSYKKGRGEYGFRTDDVGSTTITGIKNLISICQETRRMGFYCDTPLAIFFDMAIEQADKVLATGGLNNLEANIQNFKKHLPTTVNFARLSDLNPALFRRIGYKGIASDPLPIPQHVFKRIVERGKKFYELFGWTDEQVTERSKIIATSESLAGNYLRKQFPNGIMVYTPTMLERGAVYSGKQQNNPLPIIFPKRDDG